MPKVQISTEEKRGTPGDTNKRSQKVMTRCKDDIYASDQEVVGRLY